MVTTYPPSECQIGRYSSELVSALAFRAPRIRVTVIAEQTENAVDSPQVTRVWQRGGNWFRAIDDTLRSYLPDVVHVQYDESIFGDEGQVLRLLGLARARGSSTVVTVHGTDNRKRARFHYELAANGAVVVASRLGVLAADDHAALYARIASH